MKMRGKIFMLDDNKTGLDILAKIMKEKIDPQVVMLTADDSAESAITAMKLDATDYLTKSFEVPGVTRKLTADEGK